MPDNQERVTADLSAADTYTDWLQIRGDSLNYGVGLNYFSLTLSGTFSGTITLQIRKPPETGNVVDLEEHTEAVAKLGRWCGSFDVRAGFKSGNYSSGTASLELSR